MGNIDSVLGYSQVKSLVQVIKGDVNGARETQKRFLRMTPVVSQFNSLGHIIAGNILLRKKVRSGRSVVDGLELGLDQPDIPNDLLPHLPGSFHDLSFSENMPGTALLDGVLSVFFILQLMKIGHPRSKPYFNEVIYASIY